MQINRLSIPDVLLIEPHVYFDDRGYFFESFNHNFFENFLGRSLNFFQDNQSFSKKNVLRGLHFQHHFPQAKLVRVLSGKIYDVAVDIRPKSSSYGQWVGELLSDENKKQLWIPEGFAHGFLVLSDTAEILYKVTSPWVKNDEYCLIWNDADLNIDWPCFDQKEPVLSDKDKLGKTWKDIASLLEIQ